MGKFLPFVLGALVGGVAVRVLSERSSCCKRVAAAARDKATGALGEWAGYVGDGLGIWDTVPGALDFAGVEP